MLSHIKNIEFNNGTAILHKLNIISSRKFESKIIKFHYEDEYDSYRHILSKDAELLSLPPMNIVFYSSIFQDNTVLSPYNFVDEYFMYYEHEFEYAGTSIIYNSQKYTYASIVARLLRTYPSLIRDFDFFLLLVESGYFDHVKYSCSQDYNGTDILIEHKHVPYVISLFVDSKRSNFFKIIKNKIRHSYPENEIQIPLCLSRARKCGDFYLYGLSDVEYIRNKIIK